MYSNRLFTICIHVSMALLVSAFVILDDDLYASKLQDGVSMTFTYSGKAKNSCDSLYFGGLEPNLQYLRGMSVLQDRSTYSGNFVFCVAIKENTAFAYALIRHEGKACTLKNGRSGTCKKLNDCPSWFTDSDNGNWTATSTGRCGFDGSIEIVCCSDDLPESFFYAIEDYEGTSCILESGRYGTCKKLLDCPSRLEEVLKGNRSAISSGRCEFNGAIEIVCCPRIFSNKVLVRPAVSACMDFTKGSGIENGIPVIPDEFPYIVALGYINNHVEDGAPSVKYNCGGTLISYQHVLTAAHCVNNIHGLVPVVALLGTVDVNADTNSSETVQRIPISEIIPHPKYKRSAIYNDVAILKLEKEVELSDSVSPACIQTEPIRNLRLITHVSLVVIGWGATSFGDDGSDKLMKTPSLGLMDKKECNEWYTGFRRVPDGIDDSLICAVDTNKTRQANACQGDSGGPLTSVTSFQQTVIGVAAFGQFCGGPTPGVYTSVYSYLDWIEETVWMNNDTNVNKYIGNRID